MDHQDSPAKLAIIREWDAWSQKHPDDAKVSGCFSFLIWKRNGPICCSTLKRGATGGRLFTVGY
jgi:hypothetical protein